MLICLERAALVRGEGQPPSLAKPSPEERRFHPYNYQLDDIWL